MLFPKPTSLALSLPVLTPKLPVMATAQDTPPNRFHGTAALNGTPRPHRHGHIRTLGRRPARQHHVTQTGRYIIVVIQPRRRSPDLQDLRPHHRRHLPMEQGQQHRAEHHRLLRSRPTSPAPS